MIFMSARRKFDLSGRICDNFAQESRLLRAGFRNAVQARWSTKTLWSQTATPDTFRSRRIEIAMRVASGKIKDILNFQTLSSRFAHRHIKTQTPEFVL